VKSVIFVILAALFVSGCLMKRTTTNSAGVVTEEKYIITRPVKNAIKNIEVE
jgi:hypothetical protein